MVSFWVILQQLNISQSSGIYSRIPANTPDNDNFNLVGKTSLTTVTGWTTKIHCQQFDSHVPRAQIKAYDMDFVVRVLAGFEAGKSQHKSWRYRYHTYIEIWTPVVGVMLVVKR